MRHVVLPILVLVGLTTLGELLLDPKATPSGAPGASSLPASMTAPAK